MPEDFYCRSTSDAAELSTIQGAFTILPFKDLGPLLRCGACLFVEIPYNNLTEVLRRQEKHEMAGKMHRRTLEGREKALGLEHPFILASVNNLVGVRENTKRRRIWIDEHGKEGRKCGGLSIRNLAEVLQGQGKCEVAERDALTSIRRI